jgi:hypothetical protein
MPVAEVARRVGNSPEAIRQQSAHRELTEVNLAGQRVWVPRPLGMCYQLSRRNLAQHSSVDEVPGPGS